MNAILDRVRKATESSLARQQELGAKTLQLWQQTFDNLSLISIAQIRDLQSAVARWMELMHTGRCEPVAPETKSKEAEGRKVLGMSQSERAELQEAFREYEMTKGDWAMDR